jgi:anti-repressor protein
MTKRTGDSLRQTINTASSATMLTLGLGVTQAARIIRARRVLPLVENPKIPQIDARKLWEKIGKPHKRFNAWAAHYLKPLIGKPELSAEISVLTTPARGTPRLDYFLSRDLAAHLVMQANTPEGADIREYFLDMERLALRLSEHMGIRVDAIVGTDNKMANTLTKRAAEQAKAGLLPRGSVRAIAMERERLIKAIVCEVLTGHSTDYWRDTFGKRVRDVLDTDDVLKYSQCYETARALITANIAQRATVEAILRATYGGKVSSTKYIQKATTPT